MYRYQAPEPTDRSVVVIVPFYNGSNWVERAIQSVLGQTTPPDEFIIVNDGSKPEERAALAKLAERYAFRILDKENGGQGSARNAGVKASKSTFICFLDQDDYYFPDHVRDLLDGLPDKDDARLGFVYGDLCHADEAGKIYHSNMLDQFGTHPKRGHILGLLRHDLFILPSASLIYRKAFEAVDGFDEQFMGYEDDDLFLRMFHAGYTNYFVKKAVTAWCQHSGSTSWSIKMSRSRFRYFKKLASTFPNDDFTGIHYFSDGIVPRFRKDFVEEAAHAVKQGSKDREELLAMLNEFCRMTTDDPFTNPTFKRKLRLMTFALNSLPLWVLVTIRKGTRIPFLRKFLV
ncbi:glycosyltransferase family 2 protein [Paraburkholderia sp. DHOC27]|uniref:glycosyltransferase family 2 protein n=1 Tax=Paraburkholderia sp. DHOC27 TaxID=2303330 RepID=UPI000E3BAB89|nr:glycosyltransferase family A protein [Paraburkholderia sp. DHOC27]RFU45990.1 glycosyltransferase family 2 protein [Paraburkholderia sp. DHOC27]